jgi:RNA polymerase sigma-70 factor (ECF subfamily)
MDQHPSFDDLASRLERGEQDAASELFLRFANRLIALAQSHLDTRVRRKVDPEDVLQSVFSSFFVRLRAGKVELTDWGSLWGILVTITARKCGRKIEAFHAACRDVRREARLPDAADSSQPHWDPAGLDPTPSEAAVLADTVEQLLRGFEDRQREIVSLALQGYSHVEIGAQVGRTQRTVRRTLERVRNRLERMRVESLQD